MHEIFNTKEMKETSGEERAILVLVAFIAGAGDKLHIMAVDIEPWAWEPDLLELIHQTQLLQRWQDVHVQRHNRTCAEIKQRDLQLLLYWSPFFAPDTSMLVFLPSGLTCSARS